MMKKLEKGSTITYDKLSQINLKTSYQKVDKTKIKKKTHVKYFQCSILGHFSSECPNKKNNREKLSRRQRSLSQRRYFVCKETCHNVADYPKEEASKKISQNQSVWFGKPEYPVLTEKSRTSGQCNKGFKVTLDKHMSMNKSSKRQSKDKVSHLVFKPKPNAHSMCAQESSLHTYRTENGYRITNVSV
jgi:hypothetical protein